MLRRGIFNFSAAFAFLASISLCGTAAVHADSLSPPVTVVGFILDEATKQPLTEYSASYSSDSSEQNSPLVIGEDGGFIITFAAGSVPSLVTIEAKALGHYARRAQITLPNTVQPGDRFKVAAIGLRAFYGIEVIPNSVKKTYLEPRAINDKKEVAGYRKSRGRDPVEHPVFVWSSEKGSLGLERMYVEGISNTGEPYGTKRFAVPQPNGGDAKAMERGTVMKLQWSTGAIVPLTLDCLMSPIVDPAECSSEPAAMNAAGIAVGFQLFDTGGRSEPFAWILNEKRDQATLLPLEHDLPPEMDPQGLWQLSGNMATAINKDGFTVGNQNYRYTYYTPILDGADAGKLAEKHGVINTAYFWSLGTSFGTVPSRAGCLLSCPKTLPTRLPDPGTEAFDNTDPFNSELVPATEEVESTADDVNDNYEVVGVRSYDKDDAAKWPNTSYGKVAYLYNAKEGKLEHLLPRTNPHNSKYSYAIPTGISNSGIVVAMVVGDGRPAHWRPIDPARDYGERYGPGIPLDNSIPAGVGTFDHPWDINNLDQIVGVLKIGAAAEINNLDNFSQPFDSFVQLAIPYCYEEELKSQEEEIEGEYIGMLEQGALAETRSEGVILVPNSPPSALSLTADKVLPNCWVEPEVGTEPLPSDSAPPEPEPAVTFTPNMDAPAPEFSPSELELEEAYYF